MYIQVTNKCNMTCDHCAFNCTSKGQNMSMKTFKNALKFCGDADGGEGVQLGGGEPTLHPKFWEMLGLGLSVSDVWLATNGSTTETALRLCSMARRGVIGCVLSMDEWHDEIDWEVVEAFQDGMERSMRYNGNTGHHPSNYGYKPLHLVHADTHDRREIRDVSDSVSKRGRAVETETWHKDECSCQGLMCRPNGDAYPCGCLDAPKLGNVNESEALQDAIDELNEDEGYMDNRCHCDIGACEVTA